MNTAAAIDFLGTSPPSFPRLPKVHDRARRIALKPADGDFGGGLAHPVRVALSEIFGQFCNSRATDGAKERYAFVACAVQAHNSALTSAGKTVSALARFVCARTFDANLVKHVCAFVDCRAAMTLADFRLWVIACGAGFSSANEMRIKKIFRAFGTWQLSVPCLDLDGFLRFYGEAAVDRPDCVWSDLAVFSYDEQCVRDGASEMFSKKSAALDAYRITAAMPIPPFCRYLCTTTVCCHDWMASSLGEFVGRSASTTGVVPPLVVAAVTTATMAAAPATSSEASATMPNIKVPAGATMTE